MAKLHHTDLRLGAAMVALTVLWALPAAAEGVVAASGATAAAQAVAAPGDTMAVLSNSDAMARAAKRKRKPAKMVRSPARPVAFVREGRDCSGVWCGRQFVLILGIGF